MKMKSIVVHEFYKTLDEVHVSDVPVPTPKDDELLIKVIAAGVNFVDTLYVLIESTQISGENLLNVMVRFEGNTKIISLWSSHHLHWALSLQALLSLHRHSLVGSPETESLGIDMALIPNM